MTQGVRFEPTDEQRRTVRAMAGYGMPHVDIATFLDIDAKTLRKHFTRELELGSIEATTKVAQSLFRMATEGKNVAAAIFWMKARAGWREKQPAALTEDDKPVQEMSDAELEEVIRTARRSGALPTSHTVIERRIVDPKNPVRPVIDGDASEAD
jgi:hypothetical protein